MLINHSGARNSAAFHYGKKRDCSNRLLLLMRLSAVCAAGRELIIRMHTHSHLFIFVVKSLASNESKNAQANPTLRRLAWDK